MLAGVSAATLGMASVQTGAAIAISLFDRVGALAVVALRLASAAAFLVITSRPALGRLSQAEALTFGAYGLMIAAMNVFFYSSIERVPLGVAVALEMVGPIAVATLGSRRPRDLAVVALAVVGVLVLALAPGVHGHITVLGIVFALAAGACWAGYILLSAHAVRTLPGAQGLAIAMCVATVPMAFVAVGSAGAKLLDVRVLVAGAAVGLLSTGVPGMLDTMSLRRLRAATYALVVSGAPAVGALAGLLFQGQRLSAAQWLGIVIVVAASAAAVAGAEPPDATPV
jgi:inner membrane transporter RhtA